ncbi:hypothetical protein Unana1_02052 [Umbelopsis nana]
MNGDSKSPDQTSSEIPQEVVQYAKLLRTRLQYARYKVEHDLVQNTFSEIEAALTFPGLAPPQRRPDYSSPTHEAASTLTAFRQRYDLPPTPHSPPKNVPLKRSLRNNLDDFDSEEAAQTILMLSSGGGTPKLSNARSPTNGILSPRLGASSPALPYSGYKKSSLERQPSKLTEIEPQHPKDWPFCERIHERGSLSPRFITIPSRQIEADARDNPFLVQDSPSSPRKPVAHGDANKGNMYPSFKQQGPPKQQGLLTSSFRVSKPLNGLRHKRI